MDVTERIVIPSPDNGSKPIYVTLRSISLTAFFVSLPLSIAGTSLSAGALLLSYVIESVRTRRLPRLTASPLDRPLLIFLLTTLLLAPFAVNPQRSLSKSLNLTDIAIFFLLYHALTDAATIKRLTTTLLFSVAGVACYGLLQHYLEVDLFRLSRPFSFLKHLNDDLTAPVRISGFSSYMTLSGQLALTMPVMAAFALSLPQRRQKIMFALLCLVSGAALLWTYTRSGWLAAMLAVMIIGAMRLGKTWWLLVTLLLIAGAGLEGWQQAQQKRREEQVQAYHEHWTEETSSGANQMPVSVAPRSESLELSERVRSMFRTKDNQERIYTWLSTLRMIRDHLLTGIGHGNYSDICHAYRTPYPQVEFTSDAHAHNILLQVAVVGGLPLLAVFLWLWCALFRSLVQGYRALRDADAVAQSICLGVIGTAAAFCVQGMFEHNWGDSEVVITLWALVACALKLRVFSNNADC